MGVTCTTHPVWHCGATFRAPSSLPPRAATSSLVAVSHPPLPSTTPPTPIDCAAFADDLGVRFLTDTRTFGGLTRRPGRILDCLRNHISNSGRHFAVYARRLSGRLLNSHGQFLPTRGQISLHHLLAPAGMELGVQRGRELTRTHDAVSANHQVELSQIGSGSRRRRQRRGVTRLSRNAHMGPITSEYTAVTTHSARWVRVARGYL